MKFWSRRLFQTGPARRAVSRGISHNQNPCCDPVLPCLRALRSRPLPAENYEKNRCRPGRGPNRPHRGARREKTAQSPRGGGVFYLRKRRPGSRILPPCGRAQTHPGGRLFFRAPETRRGGLARNPRRNVCDADLGLCGGPHDDAPSSFKKKGTSKNGLISHDFVFSQHSSHNTSPISILFWATRTPKSLPVTGFPHARAGIPSLANQTRRRML